MTAEVTRDGYAGIGLMLLSELRASEVLGPVPKGAMDLLGPTIRTIPPQYFRLGENGHVGDWINAAAAVEAHALHDIACDLLEELRRLQVGSGEAVHQQALDSFLWVRRGRIARTSGHLDDAEECYREALRRARRAQSRSDELWWTDVLPHIWTGFGILAIGRGNYPVAERETAKILDARVPAIWRITGHLQMALVLRKRMKLIDAVEHIWAAFDLMERTDTRRAEALVPLGEVLMGLNEHLLSLKAHLSALAMRPTSRVQAAALCGVQTAIARAARRERTAVSSTLANSAWARRELSMENSTDLAEQLLAYVAETLKDVPASINASEEQVKGVVNGFTRHDQSILARSLAELLYSRGRLGEAMEWLCIVETIAERHNFHERKFEVDALRERWSHTPSESMRRVKLPPVRVSHEHPVWARMDELDDLATLHGETAAR